MYLTDTLGTHLTSMLN